MQESATLIPANVAGTLDGLFRERVRLSGPDEAYRHYHRADKRWQSLSWNEMADAVSRWQQALAGEDFRSGDRVAILMANGPDWVAFEQAALGLGLVVVPLYVDDRADNMAYILNDAGCRLVLLEETRQWETLSVHRDDLPTMQRFVIHKGSRQSSKLPADDSAVTFSDEWLPNTPTLLHERGGDPNQLATIVYTSGTTGRPKGVMLSHYNILTTAESSLKALNVQTQHTFLSFLPLSHTFERTCGYYVPMMCNASVVYSRSVQQLADDLQFVRPTVLVSVPRIFERVYDRLQQQLKGRPAIARLLFRLAVQIGWRRFEVSQGRARRGPALLLWPLLNRLVASKVQDRLGGRLQMAVSGGAALPLPVARTFIGLGINVIQGYGMTETSPVLCANRLEHNQPASVGPALPGVELQIGKQDELLARSPGVMLGYWNNHRATAEILEPDGWLHTGDKAAIDAEGFVYITGRIKDILVLSNGEKIPPADMESAITLQPAFDQALIIGEGRPYLTALVVLNPEEWVHIAQQHGLDPFDESNLANRDVQNTLLKMIGDALHDFPGYAKIRRVTALLQPWTVENGLLTPTLKVKRNKVIEHYRDTIERMYN